MYVASVPGMDSDEDLQRTARPGALKNNRCWRTNLSCAVIITTGAIGIGCYYNELCSKNT